MPLNILCTPYFSADELIALENVAKERGVSRSQVVRAAVAYFHAVCVPTQNETLVSTASSFLADVCPHI